MNLVVRRILLSGAFIVLGAYGYFTLRGPQGIPALVEKRKFIRDLEVENANLARENELRTQRLHKLESSPSEQEKVIREKLKKLQPDDTEFVLPGAPETTPPESELPVTKP